MNKVYFRGVSLVAVACILQSACTKIDYEAGTKFTGTGNPLLTTAGVRAIQRNQITKIDPVTGRVTPVTIGCAEPPPDIAIALGAGQGAGTTLSGLPALAAGGPATAAAGQAAGGTEAGSVDVSLSAAGSRAEAVSQLGERLATIQLLRDGLYRACEAYANGAITPTVYSVIVSRLDKLLVTLIATEIAGGAFGRQFSAASASASGDASASQIKSSAAAVAAALDDLKKKQAAESTEKSKLADLKGQRTAKQQALAGATAEQTTALNAEIAALDTQITAQETAASDATVARAAAEKALQDAARDQALTQITSEQTTATGTSTGGGGISGRKVETSAELAGAIGKIQSNYINELNLDALVVSCITELSQTESFDQNNPSRNSRGEWPTQLAKVCSGGVVDFKNFVDKLLKMKQYDAVQQAAESASNVAQVVCSTEKSADLKAQCVSRVLVTATNALKPPTDPPSGK